MENVYNVGDIFDEEKLGLYWVYLVLYDWVR